ncbi:MAG: aspartate kinase [Burkholderiales bacterium]|nr:aspartate kinase [Burkholderiales bacterium]
MFVIKFGGTSVTKPESVANIAILVKKHIDEKPILVVSALSGITDLLVKINAVNSDSEQQNIIEQIIEKHDNWIDTVFVNDESAKQDAHFIVGNFLKELKQILLIGFTNQFARHDSVVSFGEKISSALISLYLQKKNINAKQVLATSCIITDNNFGGADFIDAATVKASKKAILPLVDAGIVPVITGFIGATTKGEITVLGRGGSDYSAAIIAYATNSDEVQIWTDVNGVYSADPRVIQSAKLLKSLSYQEAAELAMFGAKVLHPRTIQPAVKIGIPVRVLNTFNLDNTGTIITGNADNSDGIIKSVTWRKLAPLLNIYSADMFLSKGFLQKVFAILTKKGISANLLSASEVSVSITLDNIGLLDEALIELNKFAKTDYLDKFGTISLVGEKIMQTPNLMQDLFNIFQEANVPVQMLSYSASNINISVLVPSEKILDVVPIIHKKFIG